jgi:peptidyl-prolyl cis-trans isomerase C
MERIPMANPQDLQEPPQPAPSAPITVNGVAIPGEAVAVEAQNHPAPAPGLAFDEAAHALVIRELLLQRASELDLKPEPETDDEGRQETDEDALIRQVLALEVESPEADVEVCQRYYDNNQKRFTSPVLYEAAHILFAAAPDDKDAYGSAVQKAEQAITLLGERPRAFGDLALENSDCPSGKNDGNLGQVSRGDTVPEVETFLDNLEEGQICPVPVKSRYGAHVLRLDRRIEGRQLPFEMVQEQIGTYLQEASWRRAVAQYVRILAGQAEICGAELDAATSPLVR